MKNQERFQNIDILRGLLMVIMAIDHAYLIFYHIHYDESWNRMLPDYGSIAIFFTRWISNICAPGFALLMGMSMVFYSVKKQQESSKNSNVFFFIKRGLILILLQQLLDLPRLIFNFNSIDKIPLFRGGVLYALGSSLILASFFINWKYKLQIITGFGIVVFNYFVANTILIDASNSSIISLLFIPGVNNWVSVNYPAIPWLGITFIGLGVGRYFINHSKKSNLIFLFTGITLVIVFIIFRTLNMGDYKHTMYPNSIINYLAVIKYPPSIAFVVLTTGILSLLFWIITILKHHIIFRPLLVFGKASLFFYFAHIYIFTLFSKILPHTFPLIILYLIWLTGLILLYPLCKYYIYFKSQRINSFIWRYL
jgi:uncharacterized membrane protein